MHLNHLQVVLDWWYKPFLCQKLSTVPDREIFPHVQFICFWKPEHCVATGEGGCWATGRTALPKVGPRWPWKEELPYAASARGSPFSFLLWIGDLWKNILVYRPKSLPSLSSIPSTQGYRVEKHHHFWTLLRPHCTTVFISTSSHVDESLRLHPLLLEMCCLRGNPIDISASYEGDHINCYHQTWVLKMRWYHKHLLSDSRNQDDVVFGLFLLELGSQPHSVFPLLLSMFWVCLLLLP